jgi:hypothetical protein
MDKGIDIRVANKIEIDKIVINKGEKDGIEEYMRFLVYEEGEQITDPITKKNLGMLENPKGIFKAIHIQENMTILLSELKRPHGFVRAIEQWGDISAERDILKTIKVGDKVKIINNNGL